MSYGSIYIADALELDHPLNRGLVSRWKALPGQQRGVKFRDLRKRNDGTLTNGPTWVGSRYPGGYGSLYYDGSDDFVDCGNSTAFDVTSKLTISAWFATISGIARAVVSKWTTGAGTNNSYTVVPSVTTPQKLSVLIQQSDGTVKTADGATDFSATKYNHGVLVADGTNVICYLNGKADGSIGYDGTIKVTTKKLLIGKLREEDSILDFLGNIDDVCFWNRGLSAREVSQLYQEQLRGSPETLRWYKRKAYSFADVAGGNRRRRVICGAA